MTIIPAQDRIDDCIAIRKTVFVEEQGVPIELEVDGYDDPASGCMHFLMLERDSDGRPCPVGTLRAYWESADVIHLQRFCILKEHRGRGFGRQALAYVAAYCKKSGARRITFGAQCTAIPFYEKCGCRCVSGVFLDAGMPHRTMEIEL